MADGRITVTTTNQDESCKLSTAQSHYEQLCAEFDVELKAGTITKDQLKEIAADTLDVDIKVFANK